MKKILILSLVLTGCANTDCKSPVTGEDLSKVNTLNIDSALLKGCEDLPMINENPTVEEVLRHKQKETEAYTRCRLQNSALIKVVRTMQDL